MKITKQQLRRIIREAMMDQGSTDAAKEMRTAEDFKALKPGDKLSLNGKPIVVIGVRPLTWELDYVDAGKSTRKYFDYGYAIADEPGVKPELEVVYHGPGEPPKRPRLPRRPKWQRR
jgi:hypothetical protein